MGVRCGCLVDSKYDLWSTLGFAITPLNVISQYFASNYSPQEIMKFCHFGKISSLIVVKVGLLTTFNAVGDEICVNMRAFLFLIVSCFNMFNDG